MNKIVKRVLLAGSITAAIIGGIWYATPSDAVGCSDIKIVRCGTMTHSAMKSAYHSDSEVRGIYNYFGITQSMVEGFKQHRYGEWSCRSNECKNHSAPSR